MADPVGPCGPWMEAGDLSCPADAEVGPRAVAAATEVLWALSGRRFGVCTSTVRPCYGRPAGGLGGGHGYRPVLTDGEWWNVCGHGGPCGCGHADELTLPYRPVQAVTAVVVDGTTVTEGTDWRLDNAGTLVRLGGGHWPRVQDYGAANGDPGTWSVTFTHGHPVPQLGLLAVDEMACEFVKALTGVSGCRLPQRVTSLTRQGVSMTLIDPQEFLADGRTGLYLPDLWLHSVNPAALASPSGVWSPDRCPPRRVV